MAEKGKDHQSSSSSAPVLAGPLEQAVRYQLKEELTLFRNWYKYVCFAHILSDKLNVQKIPRPFWNIHSHLVVVFTANIYQ